MWTPHGSLSIMKGPKKEHDKSVELFINGGEELQSFTEMVE